MRQHFTVHQEFKLEMGGSLPTIDITYHTYGMLNSAKDNVIWICHALTASSEVGEWWKGLVGPDKVFDSNRYFIVCANILGSCYGTTGPSVTNPLTYEKYGYDFPFYTIRDMVQAHILLKEHLQIQQIKLLVGGSMGGYQALEWLCMYPNDIQHAFLIATSPHESAWGKAIHTAQRMAVKADPNWKSGEIGIGDAGLKAARAIGMLTYRNYDIFGTLQSDDSPEVFKDHKAASYIHYQAQKLANRFDALTYYKLTEAMDTHHIARGRGENVAAVLKQILQPTLVIGISSDLLCPPQEQYTLAQNMPHATYHEIDSSYGHDGFLIEYEKIGKIVQQWMHTHHI